jgi:hypothetical protein
MGIRIGFEKYLLARRKYVMSQKDISEKILEAYNDVFSDIVNVLLFDGEEVIKPDELEEQAPRTAYKADGKYREIERDVAKRWKNGNIRVACVGLENQTEPDDDMSLRIIGYDGAEYRAQLNGEQKERYPVVTMVLYFGHKKHWDEPLSLLERLNVPDRFKPFVNDYKVNLFEIAFLDEEKVKLFKSDFRVVADYFVQMRKTGDYIANAEQLNHVQETLGLLSIMTDDRRFEDALNASETVGGKEIKTMCDVLDRVEARGKAEGIAEGEARGEVQGKKEMAINLHKQSVPVEVIAKAAGVAVDVVKKWLGLETA